ncbi:MAG: hypothetical protein AAFQ65_04845 [Myxococcota bacterium]
MKLQIILNAALIQEWLVRETGSLDLGTRADSDRRTANARLGAIAYYAVCFAAKNQG